MKELITGIATLLLLAAFLVQFTSNQVIHNEMIFIQKDVDTFVQEIKETGGIETATEKPKEKLVSNIQTDLKDRFVEAATVEITKDDGSAITNPLPRGELIKFKVTYKMKDTIAAKKFFGMRDDDDTITKVIEGETASEWVR